MTLLAKKTRIVAKKNNFRLVKNIILAGYLTIQTLPFMVTHLVYGNSAALYYFRFKFVSSVEIVYLIFTVKQSLYTE